jgi:hypothetical protein
MSKPQTMQKLLIIFASAALAVLGIAAVSASGDSPSVSSGVSPVLLAASDSRRPVESSSPAPGVYSAAPYTMLVVVPRPVDDHMMVATNDRSSSKMPIIKPEIQLENR